MKTPHTRFGFVSAIANSAVFLPHALIWLTMMLFFEKGVVPMLLLLLAVARITGDWLFWVKMFPKEMDSVENSKNWRSSIKSILLTQPLAIKSITDMVIDATVDVILVYVAFKASANPIWILFIFSICQMIGSPIQAISLSIFEKKNVRMFSMIATGILSFCTLEVMGIISQSFTKMLGLTYFSTSVQMLIILGVKCLLVGTTIISKASVAEIIKTEAVKKPVKL